MSGTAVTQLLLRRVAAELDTDLEHLDPKDVMRYDRDVYDACYLTVDEPTDDDDFVPSVGACITSMGYVLDVTQGVLTPNIRRHLRGVLLYLADVETAEAQSHHNRQMDLAMATGGQA